MEYEYCYKVTNLDEYLKYIEKNYEFKERYNEKRVIYRNNDKIGRITYKNNKKYLDFKENKISKSDLIIRKESKTIEFDNLKNCENILKFLGYKKDNSMKRIRSIYGNEKVKFEIDEYLEPEESLVISFEGDKKECDRINEEFKGLNKKYQIK